MADPGSWFSNSIAVEDDAARGGVSGTTGWVDPTGDTKPAASQSGPGNLANHATARLAATCARRHWHGPPCPCGEVVSNYKVLAFRGCIVPGARRRRKTYHARLVSKRHAVSAWDMLGSPSPCSSISQVSRSSGADTGPAADLRAARLLHRYSPSGPTPPIARPPTFRVTHGSLDRSARVGCRGVARASRHIPPGTFVLGAPIGGLCFPTHGSLPNLIGLSRGRLRALR